MFTFKQMEALYWVSALGSFEAAADFLSLAQSTVSKRLGDSSICALVCVVSAAGPYPTRLRPRWARLQTLRPPPAARR